MPFALRDDMAAEIDRLVKQGVWEPVHSSTWAAPIVVVRKRNGSIRLYSDYCSTVNNAVQSSVYPLPTTDEMLATLGPSKYFTKLDLAQAYQQLVVDDASAEVLTVNIMKCLFKVRRLPFGISIAPWLFQCTMDMLLARISGVKCYLNDIISGESLEQHAERLETVLTRLKKGRLLVNKEKYEFRKTSIEFLGHVIDVTGIHPSMSKVDTILKAPMPSSKKELQSFLGLINFYSRFLKGKAEVAEPLYHLLDRNSGWSWNSQHDQAFVALRNLLSSEAVLISYDPKQPIVLLCDASPVVIGAVLAHRLQDGTERPIAYASKTLGLSDRKYAQIDKEGLAILYGVKKFYQYLAGGNFIITTDHQPLLGLFNREKCITEVVFPRMLRWILFLAAYDYTFEYQPGLRNSNADALSQYQDARTRWNHPVTCCCWTLCSIHPYKHLDIVKLTKRDHINSEELHSLWLADRL